MFKNEKNKKLKDLNLREWVVMLPLIAAIFIMGIKPQFMLERMEPSVKKFVEQVTSPKAAAVAAGTTRTGSGGTTNPTTSPTTTIRSTTRPAVKTLLAPTGAQDPHAGHGHAPGEAH